MQKSSKEQICKICEMPFLPKGRNSRYCNSCLEKKIPCACGCGEIMVLGGRIPDFVNINGKKQIIELFGDYWHGEKHTGRTKEQEELLKINHYKQFGWDTLIIWENELKELENVKNRISAFSGGVF
jgi:hypothetical protein